MYTSRTCDESTRQINAERYVTRRMAVQEAEAFEDHFVMCAECQSEVRFASAMAAGLPSAPVAARLAKPSRRLWIWGGGSLALAAGIATLMLARSESRTELVALGAVNEPPVYLGIPVRGTDAPQDSVFETAMDSYSRRRYAAAVDGLRAVRAAGRDAVPAQFFLAVSLLFDNRAAEAVDAFQRVVAHGETPYRAEARFYRAKALLRVGRAADAQAELTHLTPDNGVVYEMGRTLTDSIARVRDR